MEPSEISAPVTIPVTLQVSSGGVSKTRTLNIPFNPGLFLSEMVSTLGEDTVWVLARTAAREAVESEAKRLMRNRPNGVPLYTDKEILSRMASYKIGTDGAQRDRTLSAIAQIGDPKVRKAALEAAGATESDLPQANAPVAQKAPKKAVAGTTGTKKG